MRKITVLLYIFLFFPSLFGSYDFDKEWLNSEGLKGIKFNGITSLFLDEKIRKKLKQKAELIFYSNKIKLSEKINSKDDTLFKDDRFSIHIKGNIYGNKKQKGVYISIAVKRMQKHYINNTKKYRMGDFVVYRNKTYGFGDYDYCKKIALDFIEEECKKICLAYYKGVEK